MRYAQSCTKDGLSPFKTYAICESACVGCGDCYDACPDRAILLPERSWYKINVETCTSCARCVSLCKHNAIKVACKEYILDAEKCVGCGKCMEVCQAEGGAITWARETYSSRGKCKADRCGTPCIAACLVGAITIVNNKAQFDMAKCTRCGKCVVACPVDAINSAKVQMDQSKCNHCGKCFLACEFGAIAMVEPEGYFAPYIDQGLCRLCGECQTACPDHSAIQWAIHVAAIDKSRCSGCGACSKACTFGAVRAISG